MNEINDNGTGRLYNGIVRSEFTPEGINALKPDEVFVFGSNLSGHHGGGAARAALNKFGAVWGQGVGLQGQSYAIPTMQGGVETIMPYVDQFIAFAKEHSELFFYVTRIGCGIAGFQDEEIAPLFKKAVSLNNVCLPKSFIQVIQPAVPSELSTMIYGQMRTLIDLLKELNNQEAIKDWDEAMDRLVQIIERNVRYGDVYAFMAIRTLWSIVSSHKYEGKPLDIEHLEREMIKYHEDRGNTFLKEPFMQTLFHYSVRKLVKYIQFLNEFRRYKSPDVLLSDLHSIPSSHCSANDPDYYFSFSGFSLQMVRNILMKEWKNITTKGGLNNDSLEEVAMGRFDSLVMQHGLKETLWLAYGDVGCHSNIQGPRNRAEGIAWGPFFKISGGRIEKGCSDFRRWPWSNTGFEMVFASRILEEDENYVHIEDECSGDLFIPLRDFSLPVYSKYRGKLHFKSDNEKMIFIKKILHDRNAD